MIKKQKEAVLLGFPVEWWGFFAVAVMEKRGVKVPQLFLFVSGCNFKWLSSWSKAGMSTHLKNEYSNTFIWPSNGHISDKGLGRADIPISKEPETGQRELVPRSFQRNTPKAGQ